MNWKGQVFYCIAVIGIIIAMQFFVSRTGAGKNNDSGKAVSASADGNAREKVVVIDAGHGGFDPGKVGTAGTLEKDITRRSGGFQSGSGGNAGHQPHHVGGSHP
ncbi:MAG: N-acetylmuramoyl-L-alanine amidase [Firmicutes bacterium]|nr:N-acetylmuramoyl-L-alanine amidase [Bacillota bacterium]